MKILILSDSHKQLSFLVQMVNLEKPDTIFALGDYSTDFEELSYLYPTISFHIVKGNCDFWDYRNPENEIVEIGDKKIFLTHGHLYGVKSSIELLKDMAKSSNCDIVVFGHTHKEYYEEENIILLNPGAAADKKYGILEVKNNQCYIELKKL